ncbi:CHAD domain-containing protein [Egbenema bharatensis]|uniref:CHAD domain-containing protein n=1 Tax=Egbenema bharatensis TaxID=3463334 RepID=UPI003A842062
MESSFSPDRIDSSLPIAGDFAYTVIAQHYLRMVEQEEGVLADKDPEYLHQMRVASRRLRTALQVFRHVIKLPKAAGEKRIAQLTRTLGTLRDLDVQIEALRSDYIQQLPHKNERKALKKVLLVLEQQRIPALAHARDTLTDPKYQKMKSAYETWLHAPQYTALGQLSLLLLIPDLLNPLLSALLLHEGWLVSVNDSSSARWLVLHDLRKMCKFVRYQAEFFSSFYSPSFRTWVDELKALQDNLGKVQDTHVLAELLQKELPENTKIPHLERAMQTNRSNALINWEAIRHRYLTASFREYLHLLLLHPTLPEAMPVEPAKI